MLRLSWHGKRTIRRMVILPVPGFSAVPESIKIISPNGTRFASVGLDGLTSIVPPLRTQRMAISFPVVQSAGTAQQPGGQPVQLPVGLSKLSIPALKGLRAVAPKGSARFTLACGSGPRIVLDGRRYRTTVTGTVGDLTRFRQVAVRLCGPSSRLQLGAGAHHLIQPARPGPFTLTNLSLTSLGSGQARELGPAAAGGRPVRVLSWAADSRAVRIGAGARSYLEVHQNANPGWTATLDGHQLTPVTLDGWQQGFVVPAGSGGTISLSFGPAKFYHAWIILSAIGVIALLVIASARRARRRVREAMVQALPRSAPAAQPETAQPGAVPRPLVAWLGLAALCVLMLIVGGPLVLAVPFLVAGAALWPNRYGVVAFGCMVGSGLLAAMAANPAATGSGAFGGPAQACALVALAAALIPVLPPLPLSRVPWRRVPWRRAGKP